ncbi:MAG: hypothetical protein JST16_06840 [Bdellovibrionales bacterium]|nr:hypothetical protein [Bdellovibrionales bacterium]
MIVRFRLALSICAFALLTACASDKYLSNAGHAAFDKRDWTKAAEAFGKDAKVSGANQVLFLMDEGVSLFEARQYKEAIDVFLKAETLAEIKDYTSISEEVGTLVTSDNVRGYKGEDFEKVLINVYLALAYSAQGNIEDAQVEARKINQLLYRMIHEGKRNYQESPFARYLSAILWESSGNYNDAYIDYKKTYELEATFPGVGSDLIAMAHKMGFRDEEQEWKKKFPSAKPRDAELPQPLRTAPAAGELVAIFEKGRGPKKIPRDGRNGDSSLPRYIPRYSEVARARLKINGQETSSFVPALDIVGTSTRYLEDRVGRMLAAKMAGVAVKGALAYGVAKLTKSDDAGMLAFIAMLASDRADLRAWQTLPAELEIARIPLPAGTYDVQMDILGWSGEVIATRSYPKLDIRAGKKQFIVGR